MTGVVAAGLYAGLFVFSPPSGSDVVTVDFRVPDSVDKTVVDEEPEPEPYAAPASPAINSPETSDVEEESEPEKNFREPPAIPDDFPARRMRDTPRRPRPFSRFGGGVMEEGGFGRRGGSGKSQEFRDARRAIFRDGVEPDWNQFDEEDRKMLERVWERSQRRKNKLRR